MIAIYVRQSIDKKDSISIDSQIDFCKKEFEEGQAYKTYIDKGYSGKNTNRPEFENLIKDIKSGLINKVIVYKLDRISRSTLDFAKIIDIFNTYKVDFISTTEKFDTSTPAGRAMLHIVMTFAQLERETIQERIKDNYYARGRQGLYMGGRAPYGFIKIDTTFNNKKTYTFKNNIEQLPYLIQMFEMYANTNLSLGKISDYLNENNIPAPSGGRWDSCKVSRILRNPVYVKADADIYIYYKNKGCNITNDIKDFIGVNGCYLYGKRESNERKYTNVENHFLSLALHKGVIDSEIFLRCQYKLDDNKQIKNTGKGKHTWIVNAKCGYCGYAVSVVKSGNSDTKYFNCRGKTNLKICSGHKKTILVKDIESVIEEEIKNKIKKLQNTKLDAKKENNKINELKLQIIEIDTQIENLINNLATSKSVVTDYINNRIEKLDNSKKLLLEKMQKIKVEEVNTISAEEIIKKILNWDNLSFEDKKNICRTVIKKIKIKDNEIEIDWNI